MLYNNTIHIYKTRIIIVSIRGTSKILYSHVFAHNTRYLHDIIIIYYARLKSDNNIRADPTAAGSRGAHARARGVQPRDHVLAFAEFSTAARCSRNARTGRARVWSTGDQSVGRRGLGNNDIVIITIVTVVIAVSLVHPTTSFLFLSVPSSSRRPPRRRTRALVRRSSHYYSTRFERFVRR